MMLRSGYRSTVTAPIVVAGTPWGAVSIGSEDPLPEESEVRLGAFCELVSLAVASAQARADLQASRARIVRAGDEQRRKLERNLHDGAQQRLVAAALTVRAAQKRWSSDPESASQLLGVAAEELDAGLEELRELARGLHPGRAHRLRPGGRAQGPRHAAAAARGVRRDGGAPREPHRGDRVLHRLGDAHQRRQARGSDITRP